MKDWKHWGIKERKFPEFNYHAVWYNLKTLRLGSGEAKELEYPEFYDVGINTLCNLGCPFCYVNASKSGQNFRNICEKAKFFFGQMSENERPFQIAIGSTGCLLMHPELCDFLETIYNLNIVPNYTTNGIIISEDSELSEKILDYTSRFVGGVAVSANNFNDNIDQIWRKAVHKLNVFGNTNINIHYIINDEKSVNDFIRIYNEYKDIVLYFVLLPLMPSGRSTIKYSESAFQKLISLDLDWNKIAFGAHFYKDLCAQNKLNCSLYPPESLSKNLLLSDVIKITPSSFNLKPIKEIHF